jgi:hypothetical protein
VGLDLYFEGNIEEECIAPNQWEFGRPPIAELYARFQDIAARSDVAQVVVSLHHDWDDPMYEDGFPPGESIHVVTSASQSEVESWLTGLCCDGVRKGWLHGTPRNAPEPRGGYHVYTVVWD